jgi:hypothetical protein
VSHIIPAADLLPGDMILDPAEHVILFAGWHTGNSVFYGYQEAGCSTSIPIAAYGLNPWPMQWVKFSPYRYNKLDVRTNMSHDPTSFPLSYKGLFDWTGYQSKNATMSKF